MNHDISTPVNRSSHSNQDIYFFSLILFIATALRLYNLGIESFWFDEIYTIDLISKDWQSFFQQVVTDGSVTRNAIYYSSLYFWAMPFEITEVSTRSLSVLFGVISIGVIYLVGRELFGSSVGLISALLMAISEFQIQYAQEARSYSLFALITLISFYGYIRATKNQRPWAWALSSLCNILLFFTHSYAIFIVAAQYVHYLINFKSNRDTLVAWGIAQSPFLLIIILTLLPVLSSQGAGTGFGDGLAWITAPSVSDLLRTVVGYIIPRQHEHSWNFIWINTIAGISFLIIGAVIYNASRSGLNRLKSVKEQISNLKLTSLLKLNSDLFLIVAWFLFPILIPFFFSLTITPLFVDRYTICAAPAFYILVAYIISRISRIIPVSISLTALAILVLPGLQDYYSAQTNEQWREAALFVQENSSTNDIILFTPDTDGYQHKSFYWYFERNLPYCGIDAILEDDQELHSFISNCTSGHERFWVVVRGTPEEVDRYNSYFSSPDINDIHLLNTNQLVGITIYLFEATLK